MFFFVPQDHIHLLSLLEVRKPVTFACSAELTQAWQHISRQQKQDAAKADAAFKESNFDFRDSVKSKAAAEMWIQPLSPHGDGKVIF